MLFLIPYEEMRGALLLIRAEMDRPEWSADTLNRISEILEHFGLTALDAEDNLADSVCDAIINNSDNWRARRGWAERSGFFGAPRAIDCDSASAPYKKIVDRSCGAVEFFKLKREEV